jgi:hypothetical protein
MTHASGLRPKPGSLKTLRFNARAAASTFRRQGRRQGM